jgi:bacterioferritin (cytochrome b1)
MQTSPGTQNVDQLNSFLRGELSAVETYGIALDKLKLESPSRSRLDACRRSHSDRVDALRSRIIELGGSPAVSSGPWGTVTTVIEASASAISEKSAISALEQGEDHGLRDYREDLPKLDERAKELVLKRLLPEQERTHQVMSELKHELARS